MKKTHKPSPGFDVHAWTRVPSGLLGKARHQAAEDVKECKVKDCPMCQSMAHLIAILDHMQAMPMPGEE